MRRKLSISALFILVAACAGSAQVDPPSEYVLEKWKKFAEANWQKIEYSREVLSKERIANLDSEEPDEFEPEVSELGLLRGVIFGKRGRIFKDRRIQGFLDRQPWYKPDPDFSNASLTKIEKENLDLVRLREAEKRNYVAPGGRPANGG